MKKPELTRIDIPVDPVFALFNAGELKAAKELALVCLKTQPNNVELINTLAGCHFHLQEYPDALKCIELLVHKAKLSDPGLLTNYAKVLYYLRRAPEAVEIMRKIFDRSPDTEIGLDYSLYLNAIGKFEKSHEIMMSLDLSNSEHQNIVDFNLGWYLIRHGQFLEGFRHLEMGNKLRVWGSEATLNLPKEKRLQNKEQVKDKVILMACEGGQGDEIIFARFVQTLKQLGAKKVIISCSPHLASIFSRLVGVDESISQKDVHTVSYDFYVPAMSSVPLLEITDAKTGIQFPYLSASKAEVDNARKHVEDIIGSDAHLWPRIALRWQGNQEFEHDQFRSVPFQKLLKFGEFGHLFSVQRDSGLDEIKHDDPVITLHEELKTWENTLGYLANMDYVITSCTSIAHAAAAMGRTVCLLAPLVPYFTWAQDGIDSDWYPTIKVFKQTKYNSWDEPIEACHNWIKEQINEA